MADLGHPKLTLISREKNQKIARKVNREYTGSQLYYLPPFAIHILNRLDMSFHQVAPKIYHTYSKI